MCGRFSVNTPREKLEERFEAQFEESPFYPKFNVAPSIPMPTITNEDIKLFQMIKWGLDVPWIKNKTGQINVRSDTIQTNPLLRKLLITKRCLIPATGFYEWKKEKDGTKTPYYFKLKKEEIFAFAGIWFVNKDSKNDNSMSFAIITSEANSLMKPIHHRMPVILHKKDEDDWLKSEENESKYADFLVPFTSSQMETHKISSKVNNPRNDFAEIQNSL